MKSAGSPFFVGVGSQEGVRVSSPSLVLVHVIPSEDSNWSKWMALGPLKKFSVRYQVVLLGSTSLLEKVQWGPARVCGEWMIQEPL